MLLTLHLIIVLSTIGSVLFSDCLALLWIFGKKERLDAHLLKIAHTVVTTGLALIIITGGLLYARAPDAYLTDATFVVKMGAVGVLIVNTYFIARLAPLSTSGPFAQLRRSVRAGLFVCGGVSVAGWATAALCGYLLS